MRLMAMWAVLFFPGASGIDGQDLASDYGFSGREIYRVEGGVNDLTFADLDGDGRQDLGFINNARSRIELYLRLPDSAPDVWEIEDPEAVNEVTYDGRFKKEYLPVEREVFSIATGHFDGDGTMDVAYVTSTGELTLVLRGAGRKTHRLDDFKPVRYGLIADDVDRDGHGDLLLLGEKKTLFWARKGEGWRGEPMILHNLEEKPGSFRLADLDGDGLKDLLYIYYQGDYPFQFRLQEAPGLFGPVTAEELQSIRAFDVRDTDGDGREEILAVYKSSGRLALFGLERSEEPVMRYYPLREVKDADEITFTAADADGDGATEIIVADGDAARLKVIDGFGSGASVTIRAHPSLKGVSDPRVADLDGNGKTSVIVISGIEQLIGVSRAGPSIEFPRFFAVEGKPLAMDTGDLNGDGTEDVVCVSTRGEGRNKEFLLNVLHSAEPGASVKSTLIQKAGARGKEEYLDKEPEDLFLFDIDRNGREDILLFMPGEVPAVFFADGEEGFEFVMGGDTPGLGILEGTRAWSVCAADADGDGMRELAACAGNLVRFLFLPEGSKIPQAVSQYNSPESGDDFSGCGFGDVLGDGAPELILYESKARRIHVVGKGNEVLRKLELDRFDFRGIESVDLNGDGKKDILVRGKNRVGVCLSGRPGHAFLERGTYESKDKESYFRDVAAGDVNGNGAMEAVLTDTGQKSLFIVSLRGEILEHALKFRVFEEKLFQAGRGGAEPRTVKVHDLTGDGRDDVVVLVHDKIILYPQE